VLAEPGDCECYEHQDRIDEDGRPVKENQPARPCGMHYSWQSTPNVPAGSVGPCTRTGAHDWHRDEDGYAWPVGVTSPTTPVVLLKVDEDAPAPDMRSRRQGGRGAVAVARAMGVGRVGMCGDQAPSFFEIPAEQPDRCVLPADHPGWHENEASPPMRWTADHDRLSHPADELVPVSPPLDALLAAVDSYANASYILCANEVSGSVDAVAKATTDDAHARSKVETLVRALWAAGVEKGRREHAAERMTLPYERGIYDAGVEDGRRQRAAKLEELQVLLEHAEQYARDLQDNGDVPERTDEKIDRIREWLRMHGDYDVELSLWASYGTIRIALKHLTKTVWTDSGTTYGKRLDGVLAQIEKIDRG